MIKRRAILICLSALSFSVFAMTGCGSDATNRRDPSLAEAPVAPRHDYTSTWVYAVGEIDAPTANDCRKALAYVEAESDCVGSVCKFAINLLKDFDAVCGKLTNPEQRQKATELRSTMTPRVGQRATLCAKPIDDWLGKGCGKDGACEGEVRQWATRCSEEVKSPLANHLLERLVENSLQDPRRVRFDVEGCVEQKQKLKEAAQCGRPFDCEGALPRIDEYVEKCAEGNHNGLPLEQAAEVMRIRFGAEKPNESISIAKIESRVVGQPGLLAFANGRGAAVQVCDEPVTDLSSYLEQRGRCDNGEVTLFLYVETNVSSTLEVKRVWHPNDATFSAAHPQYFLEGEAEAREQKAIEDFAKLLGSLQEQAATDLPGAIESANRAFRAIPPSKRQSAKLYQAISKHDAELVTLLAEIGEQKGQLVNQRPKASERQGLLLRSERLVFADVSSSGRIELGKSCDLSELKLERLLPKSFAAYQEKVEKLTRALRGGGRATKDDSSAARQSLIGYAQACTAAQEQASAAQKEMERCFATVSACTETERGKVATKFERTQTESHAARVREILAKVSMGQPDAPSAACNGL